SSAALPGSSARNRYACLTHRRPCQRCKLSDRACPVSSRRSCNTWPAALIWPFTPAFAARALAQQRPASRAFVAQDATIDRLTVPQVPVGCQVATEAKRLRSLNIGQVKVVLHRPLEGTPKTATIQRSRTGKWAVACSCECVAPSPVPKTGQHVGVDV